MKRIKEMNKRKYYLKKDLSLYNTFMKAKSFRIELQVDKNIFKRFSLWIPRLFVLQTLKKNVTSCLDRAITTWTCNRFFREEPKPIFIDWCVICNQSSYACTQQI